MRVVHLGRSTCHAKSGRGLVNYDDPWTAQSGLLPRHSPENTTYHLEHLEPQGHPFLQVALQKDNRKGIPFKPPFLQVVLQKDFT